MQNLAVPFGVFFCWLFACCNSGAAETPVNIGVSADLSPIAQLLPSQFPSEINEHMVPQGTDLQGVRFRFIRLQGPTLEILPDGRLKVFVRFYGDIQLIKVNSLCHLGEPPGVFHPGNWVYLDVSVTGRPVIKREGRQWFLQADDVQAAPAIGPGSDTKCGFLNVDVGGKLNAALGGSGAAAAVRNAISSARIPIPVDLVISQLSGPINVTQINSNKVCVYPGVKRVRIGHLAGTIASANLNLTLAVDPAIVITREECPSANASEPILETEGG